MVFINRAKSCQSFKKWTNAVFETPLRLLIENYIYVTKRFLTLDYLFVSDPPVPPSWCFFCNQRWSTRFVKIYLNMYLQCIWCQLATRISRNARCDHFRKFHNTMFLVSFFHTFHTGWCRCRHFGHLSGGKKTLKVLSPTLSIKGKFTRSNLWFLSFELNFTSLTLWIQWKASHLTLLGLPSPLYTPTPLGVIVLLDPPLLQEQPIPSKCASCLSSENLSAQMKSTLKDQLYVDIFLFSQSC